MTDSPEPEYEPDLDDGQPDPSDARVALNFSTRELTPEEYASFADYNRRDFARVQAAREADARYAEWKAENPQAAAEHEAAFEAASRAACPLLWGRPPRPTRRLRSGDRTRPDRRPGRAARGTARPAGAAHRRDGPPAGPAGYGGKASTSEPAAHKATPGDREVAFGWRRGLPALIVTNQCHTVMIAGHAQEGR